jgi:hypothetical protein
MMPGSTPTGGAPLAVEVGDPSLQDSAVGDRAGLAPRCGLSGGECGLDGGVGGGRVVATTWPVAGSVTVKNRPVMSGFPLDPARQEGDEVEAGETAQDLQQFAAGEAAGLGVPVPGACAGSRTSTSTDTYTGRSPTRARSRPATTAPA